MIYDLVIIDCKYIDLIEHKKTVNINLSTFREQNN